MLLEHVPQNNLNCQNIEVLMMIKKPWFHFLNFFLLAGYGVRKRCLRKWRQNLPAARWLPLWMSCSLYWHEMHRGKCFRISQKLTSFKHFYCHGNKFLLKIGQICPTFLVPRMIESICKTFMPTVFPRIVSAETILFWKLKCGKYSREETIQGRKLFKGGNYFFFIF